MSHCKCVTGDSSQRETGVRLQPQTLCPVPDAASHGSGLQTRPQAEAAPGGLALPELGDTGMRAGSSDHRNDPGVRHTLLLAQ